MAEKIDTSYRSWSVETLNAVRASILVQLKNIEGTGQSHSISGRQTALPDIDKLTQKLTNIESALRFKETAANNGNNGYASRFSSFGGC